LAREEGPREESHRDEVLTRFGHLLATGVAERFVLDGKGAVVEGNDADFALLDLDAPHEMDNADLLYRHRQGPYAGRASTVRVVETRVRGVRSTESRGRLLTPRTPAHP
jgi:allantoinase